MHDVIAEGFDSFAAASRPGTIALETNETYNGQDLYYALVYSLAGQQSSVSKVQGKEPI